MSADAHAMALWSHDEPTAAIVRDAASGNGAGGENRTPDLRFTKPLHYRCATPAFGASPARGRAGNAAHYSPRRLCIIRQNRVGGRPESLATMTSIEHRGRFARDRGIQESVGLRDRQ